MRRVDQHSRQVQQTSSPQLGEQAFMQLLPDAGLMPLGQPPPARGARGSEQGGGQAVPVDAGTDDVQDAFERGPVVGALAAGIAEPPRVHRKEWLQSLPQLGRSEPPRAYRDSGKPCSPGKADTPTHSELTPKAYLANLRFFIQWVPRTCATWEDALSGTVGSVL